MTIKVGDSEIGVPKFICASLPKHQKDFDKFLKAVLVAQANRIRKKENAFNTFFNNMFNGTTGGGRK